MEFKIKHQTKAFHSGAVIPIYVIIVSAFFMAVALSGLLSDNNFLILKIFGVFWGIQLLVSAVFTVLNIAEMVHGTKISVESDHIGLKMFLRHRTIPFSEIEGVDFSHDEFRKRRHTRSRYSRHSHHRVFYRARLDILLYSGKKITLNDDAPGYAGKLRESVAAANQRIEMDPNEGVHLYQAYQCYLSARRAYNRGQI